MLKPQPPPLSGLDVLEMAWRSLGTRRLRAFLTMLGVVIGIASVIVVTAVGQGVQLATAREIQNLGTNLLQVQGTPPRVRGIAQAGGTTSTLTWEDAQAVAAQAPSVQLVAPYLTRQRQVTYGTENTFTLVNGVDENFWEVRQFTVAAGRVFTPMELDTAQSLVVLGATVARDLFGQESPLGKSVRIQGDRYEVIGVLAPKGTTGGFDQDDQVFIPLKNMAARIVGQNALQGIAISGFWVQVPDESEMEAAQFQITNLLRIRHNIYPPQPDDFRINNQGDIISAFTAITGLLTVMVGAIAAISLVVGGIGIANIMLVSVVERTREIGIRKAVGATQAAILQQFLAEAVLVSLCGGVIGLLLGVALAWGVAQTLRIPFALAPWAMGVSLVLSAVVGLVAGVAPAQYAARLDPIVALRTE
ncbi:MAG: ABC transporter permease [Gloeomargarita sp. SKYG116]|nr:ABC transporter permease [Gloeomargarita sp. SKYG116]MCS7226592.1 ABC transporter permease [Gloeomargarita sp. SKYB31]MDW8400715.1 ABC transporter permease [Gloeomargarita sp. SKYGB_i_bin116]